MTSDLVLSTEVKILDNEQKDAWRIWSELGSNDLPQGSERKYYTLEDDSNHFMELIAIDKFSDLEYILINRKQFISEITPKMASDFHQQVFQHVKSIKPIKTKLPQTPKLQMRYVEVPLSVHNSYLEWREGTIFDVVSNADSVEVFLAYHTLLSKQPGVMFFSGFSGDSNDYMSNVFSTPRYKNLIKEAGTKYIAGGEGGLYTKIFISE
jgi:hypothetical protein